jgi:APA family basic amino acid/polyamine antiporter
LIHDKHQVHKAQVVEKERGGFSRVIMASGAGEIDGREGTGLVRRLGLGTATALVVGEVIGVGIFLTPAGMARSLGSPFWLLLVWLTMGLAAIGGAVCYGTLAARYPEPGGTYVYLREVYGRRAAFLYGWLSLLVTDPGLTAMLAVGLAHYASHLARVPAWGLTAIAVASILTLAAVNVVGVSLGSRVMGALAALKIGLLAFLVLWGFAFGQGEWGNLTPFWSQREGSEPLVRALPSALIGAFISFAGWWDVSKIAGEVRDPRRTLPRALVLGVSMVTIVYVAVSVVFLYLVPAARLAKDEQAFAALAGDALFRRRGEITFTAVVLVSVAGSLAAILMAAPRVYYAMARDGLFFPAFAAVDPRRGSPTRAIAIQATLASILALTGTFGQILSYFMVPTLTFLALTVTGIFVLRSRFPVDRSLATPGYPISPLLFLLPVLTVIVFQTLGDPRHSLIGLLVVALGIPFSGLVLSKRPAPALIVASRSADAPAGSPSVSSDHPPITTIGTNS